MKHLASPQFWGYLDKLPGSVQQLARENYELLKTNPYHPSLHFKRIGRFWSVRVRGSYRALGVDAPDGIVWFWIGTTQSTIGWFRDRKSSAAAEHGASADSLRSAALAAEL